MATLIRRSWHYIDLELQPDVGRAAWLVEVPVDGRTGHLTVERTRLHAVAWGPTLFTTAWYPNEMAGRGGAGVAYVRYGYTSPGGGSHEPDGWPELIDNPSQVGGRATVVSSMDLSVQRLAYNPTDGSPVYSWVAGCSSENADSSGERRLQAADPGDPVHSLLVGVAVSMNGIWGPESPEVPFSATGWVAVLLAEWF